MTREQEERHLEMAGLLGRARVLIEMLLSGAEFAPELSRSWLADEAELWKEVRGAGNV